MEGVHEASSADIDNDGYLDIYSKGRLGISQPSLLYKNMGNFELKCGLVHKFRQYNY